MKFQLSVRQDLLSGLVFLLISLSLLLMLPTEIVVKNNSTISAQTFPKLVLTIMFVCSMLLIAKSLIFKKGKLIVIGTSFLAKNLKEIRLSAIFICYALLTINIGFIISSVLVSLAILYAYNQLNRRKAIISCSIAIAISLFFKFALGVILP